MNADTAARIAAWNVIADAELPAGTKVVVEGGWVTVQSRGGQSARTPYSSASTIESLYSALKAAAQATALGAH